MRTQPHSHGVEAIVGALADRQYGVVARWQLLARGLTTDAIGRRVRSGYLRPVHRGVYLVGHEAQHPLAKPAAALLACHPGATLSHRTAASLQGLLPYPAQAVCWVTKPGADNRRTDVRVVRAALDPRDITRHERLPITTPARTLLDLASLRGITGDQLEQAVAEAHALNLARLPDLREMLDRNHGHRGAGRLRALVERDTAPSRTHEGIERRLRALIRRSALPTPETRQELHGREVDFLWRSERVVVEADSYAFHSHSRKWARDVGKSNELQLRGYLVLRFTWFDVTERPDWVIAEIGRALERRGYAEGARSGYA